MKTTELLSILNLRLAFEESAPTFSDAEEYRREGRVSELETLIELFSSKRFSEESNNDLTPSPESDTVLTQSQT